MLLLTACTTLVPVIPEIEEELPRPEFHGAESSEPVRFYDIYQPYYELVIILNGQIMH